MRWLTHDSKVTLSVFLLAFLTLPLVCGQGFVYLSNTNQNVTANSSVGNTFTIGFTTGTNSSGYVLNAVTVLFRNNVIPVLTSAALYDYSTTTSFQNAVQVGTAGYYTFAPNSPISLAANTPYAFLFFALDPQANLNLSYTTSATAASVDNWNVPGLGEYEIPLFAITAQPVVSAPEPSATSVACTGIVVFIALRMQRQRPVLNQKAHF